jgi:protoheme IX farnesyltransferase
MRTVHPVSPSQIAIAPPACRALPVCSGDLLALTKPRVVVMALVTTAVGFYLGARETLGWWRLFETLIGTALAAAGTIALNQYLERDLDALMERTRLRPLPAGRLRPTTALAFGAATATAGLLHLMLAVDPLAALLAALTVVSYLFAYTPLKRKSPLSTLVGAVPGGLPPMIGWVAARGALDLEAWVLFGILFLWQIPHALAIAVLYRADYGRAGFRFLPVVDREGTKTGLPIVSHCFALIIVSLLPALTGMAGSIYFFGALALGLVFLGAGVWLAIAASAGAARRLLLASFLYLPTVLALMAVDKVSS